MGEGEEINLSEADRLIEEDMELEVDQRKEVFEAEVNQTVEGMEAEVDQRWEVFEIEVDQPVEAMEFEADLIGEAFKVEEGQKGEVLEAKAMGGRIKTMIGAAKMILLRDGRVMIVEADGTKTMVTGAKFGILVGIHHKELWEVELLMAKLVGGTKELLTLLKDGAPADTWGKANDGRGRRGP